MSHDEPPGGAPAGKPEGALLDLWTAGRRAEALAAAQARVARLPSEATAQRSEALLVLSLEAEDRGDLAKAIEFIAEATRVEPRHFRACLRQANLQSHIGQWAEALVLAEAVVKQWPSQPGSHLLLARCLVEAERHEDAKIEFLQATHLAPQHAAAHVGLGECLLVTEDWLPGWREYVWQTRMGTNPKGSPRFKTPAWNGMRLPNRRLILFADQGFGDCIQFCRFIPRVVPLVGQITLAVTPKLQSLLGRMPGITDSAVRQSELPVADAHCNLSDLPLLLGGREADLAAGDDYLPLLPARRDAWRQRLERDAGGTLKVGLCWSGRSSVPHLQRGALSLAALAPLAAFTGVTFFSLQFDAEKQQLADWPDAKGRDGGAPLIDLSAELEGFDETAHAMAALDLVITVDTVTSHLGGAIGTPTWTLLRRIPDWRWLLRREDSPWYPSMRLFRQDETRTWAPVVARVADELATVLRGERERLRPPSSR